MKLILFALYDVKTGVYLSPFPARNHVDAVRNLKDGFRNPQMRETPVGQNPQDFDLYKLGYFDDESGETIPDKMRLCSVAELAPKTDEGTVSS